VSSII